MEFLQQNLIYTIPAMGIIGLLVMFIKSAWVSKQDAGDAKMQELAGYIADGAMAFLKAEWRVLSIFVVFAAALLAYSGTIHEVNGKEIHSSWIISIAFIIGAVFSATAGYIGMKVATKANVRTTQAARTSLKQALKVSLTGSSVMSNLNLSFFLCFLGNYKSLLAFNFIKSNCTSIRIASTPPQPNNFWRYFGYGHNFTS